jgi:cardiolipin synthase
MKFGQQFSYNFFTTTQDAWVAMYHDLASAKSSIYWELYILQDTGEGKRFVDILLEQARRGLDVKLIIDTFGSFNLSKETQNALRQAGVEFLWYNKLYPEWRINRWINRLWIRNHRKVLIIDEQVAFVGGVNIDNSSKDWDDLQLRLEGEVVKPLLRGFGKTYIHATGNSNEVSHFFRPYAPRFSQELRSRVAFLLHSPHVSPQHSSVKRFYSRSLRKAVTDFTLLTPYYAPDKKFLAQIYRAKKRGVQIDILLPLKPDHKFLEYMAQSFYEATQKVGARIFLLPKMNHGKALSVDGVMGLVGSVNFTPRGFNSNEEAGVYFKDPTMVSDVNRIFDKWKQGAALINEVGGSSRRWYQRFLGWAASYFKDFV